MLSRACAQLKAQEAQAVLMGLFYTERNDACYTPGSAVQRLLQQIFSEVVYVVAALTPYLEYVLRLYAVALVQAFELYMYAWFEQAGRVHDS